METKIEVERCYTKMHEGQGGLDAGVQTEEVQDRITWRMKTQCIGPK